MAEWGGGGTGRGGGGRNGEADIGQKWYGVLGPLPTHHVIFNKLLLFSEPRFLHLQNLNNTSYLLRMV